MKVKKYVGDTMQDTIFKVKADMGSDAIIINTRKFRKGGIFGFFGKKKVEVLAALEEENPDRKTLEEINNLKNMIRQLNKRDNTPSMVEELSPSLQAVYSHLEQQGVNEDFLHNLIREVREQNPEDREMALLAARERIKKFIGESSPITVGDGRKVIVFTGPTGVGKTTTIAKLAALFALEEEKRVGLITADTYRIAAVQQLQTYSDIVNLPLKVVYSDRELAVSLEEEFSEYDLVLIDTAGSSWNDSLQLNRIGKFTSKQLIDEVHLLLSLNTKTGDLRSILKKFSLTDPDKLLLTKLDETNVYGDLINLRNWSDLPYSYITFGQDVPEDIKVADGEVLAGYIMGDYND